ncbi:tetratricopeptide repeat protein [Magnetospira sp. QH-2]|uniref:tetratricopeptide repeat protein n=1 Tax=Magnetospira sp. (strain QH-2) TaxID=1288970 RepID=UPI0003E812FD|nr:tetratricopeptide repeat protein [Magnetospira sp. QH-2]CCQ75028.1 conserved exported protein of unknown function with Ser1 repeat [Magnetospira sp. QH-2]
MRVFVLLSILIVWSIPAQADFAAGMGAYEAGDFVAAREAWHPLAEAGDPRAQYWMGDLYRFGKGVMQDFKAAMGWYKQAARQTEDGDMLRRAAYALGYMVEDGSGTPKDLDKAECLYRVAAENGYASGQWAYFLLLRNKPGLDFTALDWVERAAAQGFPRALVRVGQLEILNPYSENDDGYMEIVIAASTGNEEARSVVNRLQTSNDPKILASLKEGERRARDWRPDLENIPDPPIPVPEHCWTD